MSKHRLFERTEVKHNSTAHIKFLRLSKLMKAIDKNDALYSSAINTYCLLYTEIVELNEQLKTLYDTAAMLKESFERLIDDPENAPAADEMISFEKSYTRLISQKLSVCAMIDKKRKMMLDIDKENVMTISAALRSIPKQPEKKENPLMAALMGDKE